MISKRMVVRSTIPRVLLLLAAFVFFSANTVYFLEAEDAPRHADFGQRYHFDFETVRPTGPALNLKSALLVNYDNGEVLFAKNCDEPRSIASLTKLVTAMVILDMEVSLDTTAVITREDARNSSRSRLRVGYELTVRDLLHAMLMNSDNRAARALARVAAGSQKAFVTEMNRKVRRLGLSETVLVEPSGLDERNQSTAHEIAKLLHYAYSYPLIAQITSHKRYQVHVANRRGVTLQMANTNLLVHSQYKVLAGKTGYISAADYCLVTLVRNGAGERLTLVVLGAPGDNLRFREARKLIDWGYRQLDQPVLTKS